MSDMLSMNEVFQLAIQIEANGAAFYRQAAKQHVGAGVDYLLALAAMEDEHRRLFSDMQSTFLAREPKVTTELRPEGGLYLAAVADGFRLEGSPKVLAALTGRETLAVILQTAIGLEKDAILFYMGMRDLIADATARKTLESIIAEEKKHIVQLAEKKRSLKA